jgi:hypothetical protein
MGSIRSSAEVKRLWREGNHWPPDGQEWVQTYFSSPTRRHVVHGDLPLHLWKSKVCNFSRRPGIGHDSQSPQSSLRYCPLVRECSWPACGWYNPVIHATTVGREKTLKILTKSSFYHCTTVCHMQQVLGVSLPKPLSRSLETPQSLSVPLKLILTDSPIYIRVSKTAPPCKVSSYSSTSLAKQPSAGHSRLNFEVSRSHAMP